MPTDSEPTTITEAIRHAIVECGLSFKHLERETGVSRQSLMRFVNQRQSLRLDKADLLARYFGLTITEER